MPQKFDFKDLTILIQGPIVFDYTEKTINAVLDLFPTSQIVFSTWYGSIININNYKDANIKFIFNKDPGPDKESIFNSSLKSTIDLRSNTLRMIFSSLNGLKIIRTEWTLRIRSDILIKNVKFIDEYFKEDYFSSLFKSKILVSKVVDSKYIDKFFIDDWFEFGNTTDLEHLFSNAYYNILNHKAEHINEPIIINRFVFAEKIIWNSLYEDINFLSNKVFYEEFVDNNLLIINNFNQRCFKNLKYPKHNSLIYSLLHDISYKRHYEVVQKRIKYCYILKPINYIRKLNSIYKKIKLRFKK